MRAALLLGLSLLVKQAAELISELEQWTQGGMRLDQIFPALSLRGIEALGWPAQTGQIAPMSRHLRSD